MRAAVALVLAACGATTPVAAPIESRPAPIASVEPLPSSSVRDTPASYSPVDGLEITDIVLGVGREARAGDRIRVLYEGTLDDGTVFDSTATRGNQPVLLPLGQGALIKGWELGIVGMRAGGKRKLVIVPELGYGRSGGTGKIPPGSTLTFVVELLEIL